MAKIVMQRNSLSRIILGSLILLIMVVLSLPFILRGLKSRLPRVETSPVGNNLEIPNSETVRPKQNNPDNTRRLPFQSVSGEGSGELTIEPVGDQWSISVQANLPELKSGYYQLWLVRTQAPTSSLSLGALIFEKGGYLTNLMSTTDLKSYQQVWITRQTKDSKTPGQIVLRLDL